MAVDLSTIESITRLAEQFGPFLFAVLFILFVTRVARGYYVECMTRTAPPSTEQEQKTYRLYFLCSVWVGIAVMSLSIGWWIYAQARGNHVYQIAIVDLNPDETVLSNFYYKNTPRPTINGEATMHDAYFLVVQDRPFNIGDRLTFQYFKISRDPTAIGTGTSGRQIEIKFTGGTRLSYRLKTDQSGPRLEIVAQSDSRPASVFTDAEISAVRSRYANLPQLASSESLR